jgi:hypothetical protein
MYGIKQQKRNLILSSYLVFSVIKLIPGYTGYCMKVRRSSDNTTQDIGFVDGVLDTASLLTFVGGNNGFVDTWYDQCGSRNATQSNPANQFQIVNAGTVNTLNEKPSVKTAAGCSMTFTTVAGKSIFAVTKINSNPSYAALLKGSDYTASPVVKLNNWRVYTEANNFPDSQYYVNGFNNNPYNNAIRQNIVSMFRVNTSSSINQISDSTYAWIGEIQAILIFETDESLNRISIEESLANKFGMYILSMVDTPSWGTPFDISVVGDTAFDATGTKVEAYSYGQSGANLTINNQSVVKSTSWGTSYANAGMYTKGGIGSDFESMMDSLGYNNNIIDLNNLTPGKHYLFQYFASDNRVTSNRDMCVTMEGYTSDHFQLYEKQSVKITFQALYTTHTIILSSTDGSLYCSGWQLRILD